jgi:hypothetical protein
MPVVVMAMMMMAAAFMRFRAAAVMATFLARDRSLGAMAVGEISRTGARAASEGGSGHESRDG